MRGSEPEAVVPELDFPAFPALDHAERNADGTVTVSGDYIVRLAEYRVRIGETERNYRELRALIEKKGGEDAGE